MRQVMETPVAERNLEQALQLFMSKHGESSLADDPVTTQLLLALVEANQRLEAQLRAVIPVYEQPAAPVPTQPAAPIPTQPAAPIPTQPAQRRLLAPVPAPPPRVERPLSFWATRVPAYDAADSLSAADAARFLARPRVKPSDVELTGEDLRRQPSPRKRFLRVHGLPLHHYYLSALAMLLPMLIAGILLWLALAVL